MTKKKAPSPKRTAAFVSTSLFTVGMLTIYAFMVSVKIGLITLLVDALLFFCVAAYFIIAQIMEDEVTRNKKLGLYADEENP